MADFKDVVKALKETKEEIEYQGRVNDLQLDNISTGLNDLTKQEKIIIAEEKAQTKQAKETTKATKEQAKSITDGIGGIIKNDFTGGVKKIGDTLLSPLKGFADAIPGMNTLGAIAKTLGGNVVSAAKQVQLDREKEGRDKKQISTLESIVSGINGLSETFMAGLGKAGGMGLGVIAGLIAAPVIMLVEFFKSLSVELKFLNKLTKGKFSAIIKPFTNFVDKFDDIGRSLQRLKVSAIENVVKSFQNFTNMLGNSAKAIGKVFAGGAGGGFLTKIADVVGKVFGGIKSLFNAIMKPAAMMAGFVDGFMGPFRMIAKFAAGFGKILGKVFLPITIIMGAFDFITGFIDGFKTDGILGGLQGGITKLVQGIIGFPLDLLKKGVEYIGELMGFDMSFMKDFSFSELIGDLIALPFNLIKGAFNWISTLFTDPMAALQQLWDGLTGGIDSFIGLVTWPLNTAINWIMGLFGWSDPDKPFSLWEFIKGAVSSVWNWFTSLFSFDFSAVKEGLFKIGTIIKALAKGGVAAVKAMVPGGESPGEAFSRVYNEVVNGGEGNTDVEQMSGFEGEDDGKVKITPEQRAAIEAKMDEMRDRINRSLEGENIYTGPDAIGRNIEILKLQAMQKALDANYTVVPDPSTGEVPKTQTLAQANTTSADIQREYMQNSGSTTVVNAPNNSTNVQSGGSTTVMTTGTRDNSSAAMASRVYQ